MSEQVDLADFENPMVRLAKVLGNLEYPQPPSDSWVRVALTLAPCTILILCSVFWEWGAPFLLVFAGAFASIQMVHPYERMMTLVKDYLNEARDQDRSPVEWARVKLEFHNTASYFQGVSPIGYSPAALARARRRFTRLSALLT